MKKSNGIVFEQLVFWIVPLVLLVLLIPYFLSLLQKANEAIEQTQCKVSVSAMAKLPLRGDQIKDYRLSCPMRSITITKEEEVFPTVAKEMALVWDNFGEGQLELFAPEDEVFCALGSYVTFHTAKIELSGFLPYLIGHNYKKTSFFEFLTGQHPPTGETLKTLHTELQHIDIIDTKKPLGIIFVFDKEEHLSKAEGSLWGFGVGTVLGTAAGIATLFYFPPGIAFPGLRIITFLAGTGIRLKAAALAGAYAGVGTGYFLGHDASTEWNARILVVPFTAEEINKLPCTYWPIPVA